MKNLLLQLRADWRDTRWAVNYDRYANEERRAYALRAVPVWLETTECLAYWYGVRLVCRAVGHKLVDHSTAGPDTGDVSISCERCGWSHHQVMY